MAHRSAIAPRGRRRPGRGGPHAQASAAVGSGCSENGKRTPTSQHLRGGRQPNVIARHLRFGLPQQRETEGHAAAPAAARA